MTAEIVSLPRAQASLEELHDLWLAAVRRFQDRPCQETSDRVLERYQAYYRKRNGGSSVGLEEWLEKMEARMGVEIEKARAGV